MSKLIAIRQGLGVMAVAAILLSPWLVPRLIAPAQAASGHHRAVQAASCDWRPVHRIDRWTTWQYVTPALARYEHIGKCSKVITGDRQSVIIGQDGHVADVS